MVLRQASSARPPFTPRLGRSVDRPAVPILGWLLLTIVGLVSYFTLYLWLAGLGGPVGEWEDAAAKPETEWDHAVGKWKTITRLCDLGRAFLIQKNRFARIGTE